MEPATKFKQEDLFGGKTADESAKLFLTVLNGEGTKAQNEVVIANAGIAIHCATKRSLDVCFNEARESLQSKQALNVYNKLINVNS
jgi:anthranilate phosphoribosyltransferase